MKLYIICLLIIIGCLFIQLKRAEGFETQEPTFHIFIATGGRPSLKNMLDSLKDELKPNDAITVVFDGPGSTAKSGLDDSWLEGHLSKITTIEQNPNLGFWGHGIRNKYQGILTPKTTYIMNADDDDLYIKGSFDKLRKSCTDSNMMYIAKMKYEKKPNVIIPNQTQELKVGNIGTPNGIIPTDLAAKSEWGYVYGGDFMYYDGLIKAGVPYTHLDHVIYNVF